MTRWLLSMKVWQKKNYILQPSTVSKERYCIDEDIVWCNVKTNVLLFCYETNKIVWLQPNKVGVKSPPALPSTLSRTDLKLPVHLLVFCEYKIVSWESYAENDRCNSLETMNPFLSLRSLTTDIKHSKQYLFNVQYADRLIKKKYKNSLWLS